MNLTLSSLKRPDTNLTFRIEILIRLFANNSQVLSNLSILSATLILSSDFPNIVIASIEIKLCIFSKLWQLFYPWLESTLLKSDRLKQRRTGGSHRSSARSSNQQFFTLRIFLSDLWARPTFIGWNWRKKKEKGREIPGEVLRPQQWHWPDCTHPAREKERLELASAMTMTSLPSLRRRELKR